MALKEPGWWYGGTGWQRRVLWPAAALYGRIATLRAGTTTPERAALPVICVGNFTAGGTGKTPMALLLADIVEAEGGAPWFLSRGYGGRLDGQERVDLARHTAAEVGDEPLLLAARAPAVISRDRRLGAEFIARQAPANAVIIMDDGLQNARLAKDLTIAVVDCQRGLGNEAVIPAGPLRAPVVWQMARTDVIVINGAIGTRARDQLSHYQAARHIPQLSAAAAPIDDTGWLSGRRVVAYAGIANPERFFALLKRLGAEIAARVTFGDHETLSDSAAAELLARADALQATLVTTEKDYVRLAGLGGRRVPLQAQSRPLRIALRMPEADRELLTERVARLIR